MIKCAIFDLDGTLVDTSIDLGRATAYVLEAFGIEPKWSDADYRAFVGDGARKLLDRAFCHMLDDEQLDRALELFKGQYNKILLDNPYIYDGILKSLDTLKKQGIKLAVVTNKPHASAVLMVEGLFGKNYFDIIIGASEDKPKKPNPYAARLALDALKVSASEALFFGDSDVDIKTAENAGIKSVACLWGFRSYDNLVSACPDFIIDNPCKIPTI